jgi:hypothetical protein
MVRCKVDPLIKETLLGHHTGLEENYYRPEDQDLLEQYLKCVDELVVNQEHKLRLEVQTLRVEMSKMDNAISRINHLYEKFGFTYPSD